MHSERLKGGLAAADRPLYLSLPSLGTAGTVGGLFLLTVFHLWLASYLPPASDELYYWSWAQDLQSSYFDHPPMVAYFIWFSTAIFGDSILAIRFPAVVVTLMLSLLLLNLTPRGNLAWGLLLSPLALLGGILITPDLPLMLFWTLYMIWFASINRTLDGWNHDPVTRVYRNSPVAWWQWAIGGLLLGLGGLSKYTMLLAIPCVFMALVTRTRPRAWAAGFAVHLLIASLVVLPVFLYAYHLDFIPFRFQWNHSMKAGAFSISRWFGFVGDQILLVGALPFLVFPLVLARARDLCNEARSQAYFWFFTIPFLFFLYKAWSTPLEANWPIVAYVAFWPLVDRLFSWSSFQGACRGAAVLSFLPPVIASLLLLTHIFHPFARIQPYRDRVHLTRAQQVLTEQVAQEFRSRKLTGPLYVDHYMWASHFRYLGVPTAQLVPAYRPTHFTIHAESPCGRARDIIVMDGGEYFPSLRCFPKREVIASVPLVVRGEKLGHVWLARYSQP